MATEFHNLVGQGGTYDTTGTPHVDLDGSAPDDHQAFSAAVTDDEDVTIVIKKDATNLLVWRATFDSTPATDTLTLVAELESIGTISNTDTVTCYLIHAAQDIKINFEHSKKFISGIVPSWTDDDTIAWSAGQAVVDGELLDYAGANTGNLGQGDAGLSATGVWHHFLYDNAGTPTIELSQTACTRDADDLYWQKSGDATRRLVGWHWVYLDASTRKIGEFYAVGDGNILTIEWPKEAPCTLQSGSPGTTMIEKTNLSNVVPPEACLEVKLNTKMSNTNDGDDLNGLVSAEDISSRAGKASSVLTVRATFGKASGWTFFGPVWMVLNDANSLWVAVQQPSGTVANFLLELMGGRIHR